MQRERERTREREAYDQLIAFMQAERARSFHGQVVVHGRDLEWGLCRQAYMKTYMWPTRYSGAAPTTVLDGWTVFVQQITTHSGKHRHQGGLVIYVLEGEGYTVLDGVRQDWEAGDLLLLPIQPGGVEHQHFNTDDSKPAKWMAFINASMEEWGSNEIAQIEQHPDFKENRSSRQPARR